MFDIVNKIQQISLGQLSIFVEAVLVFMFVISIVVFIHEFGHYLFARIYGVYVTEFSIGFGKEIFGFTDRLNTRWKFCIIPMGGYIKMYGDASADSAPDSDLLIKMSDAEKKMSFHYKSLWQKSVIAFAGPMFNILSAIIVMVIIFSSYGQYSYNTTIDNVLLKNKADIAGLQKGDIISYINGVKINTYDQIKSILSNKSVDVFDIQYTRNNDPNMVIIKFQNDEERVIGISFQPGFVGDKLTILNSFYKSILIIKELTVGTFDAIYGMIVGTVSPDQMSGPIGIAQYSLHSAKAGIASLIWLMIIISINLGIMNLLPIPVLDGGQILYCIFEAIFGNKFADKYKMIGYKLGILILLLLFVFTIYNDIRKLLI